MIVPALLAKLLSAGAVAQAATGAGVVVVVVAGAGATGVLPQGPQQTFDGLVGTTQAGDETDTLSETESDDVAGEEGEGTDLAVVPPLPPEGQGDEENTVELTDAEAAAAWAEGPADLSQEGFKTWLAEGKANGWVNGKAVSKAVHARNEARKAARADEREDEREDEVGDEVEAPEVEAPEVEAPEVEDESGDDDTEAGSDDGDHSGKGERKAGGKARGGRG